MIKKFPYILLSFFLSGMAACSDENGNEPVIPEGEKEEIVVYAGISTTAVEVQTKAESEFTKNFDLFYAINGSALTSKAVTEYVSASRFYRTGQYWDDHDGVNAYVNMLGVFPKTSLAVEGLDAISWSIQEDQSKTESLQYTDVTDGYEASDLLISKQFEKYNLNIQKDKDPLQFHHVMAKVTFKFNAGKGFLEDNEKDAFKPQLKLLGMMTSATVKASDRVVTALTGSSDITPKTVTAYEEVTAILIPGQTFTKTNTFAEVTMDGDQYNNVYKIALPATFATDKLILEQGKNHIFEITIHKTDIGLRATVVDWDQVIVFPSSEIKIGLEQSDAITGGVNAVNGALMFIQVDNQKNSYRHVYDDATTKSDWTTLSEIYWDDVNYDAPTGIKATGLLYNIDTKDITYTVITENPEHIYVGESQNLTQANDTLRIGKMTHPFSKLNIKVQSHASEDDKVEIKDIKLITLANAEKFKQVNVDPDPDKNYMKIEYETSAEYSYESVTPEQDGDYNVFEMVAYIEPGQTFRVHATDPSMNDLLMTVQVVTNGITNDITNDYILRMPSGEVTFEANKEYNINVTLKKTSVALNISIADWGKGTIIDDDANIDIGIEE